MAGRTSLPGARRNGIYCSPGNEKSLAHIVPYTSLARHSRPSISQRCVRGGVRVRVAVELQQGGGRAQLCDRPQAGMAMTQSPCPGLTRILGREYGPVVLICRKGSDSACPWPRPKRPEPTVLATLRSREGWSRMSPLTRAEGSLDGTLEVVGGTNTRLLRPVF